MARGAQNFNFDLKFLQNGGCSTPNFVLLEEHFSIWKKITKIWVAWQLLYSRSRRRRCCSTRDAAAVVSLSTLPLHAVRQGYIVKTNCAVFQERIPDIIDWHLKKDYHIAVIFSALEVIFNVMRSINPRFTYLLAYFWYEYS